MSLPTPSQSAHTNDSINVWTLKRSIFHASILLGVNKVLQKLTKSYKSELRHLLQCCILIPRKCPSKTPFQHTVPPPSCPRSYWMPPKCSSARPSCIVQAAKFKAGLVLTLAYSDFLMQCELTHSQPSLRLMGLPPSSTEAVKFRRGHWSQITIKTRVSTRVTN